jgi:hypothetical protein
MAHDSITFTRPSRTGGHDHRVSVDAATLRPISCTCRAGINGLVCWASLEVAASGELHAIAHERWTAARGVAQLERAATLFAAVARRARKARREIALRDGVGSDPDVRYLLTSAGADALARLTAERWLFGPGPSVAEVAMLGAAA